MRRNRLSFFCGSGRLATKPKTEGPVKRLSLNRLVSCVIFKEESEASLRLLVRAGNVFQ